MHPRSHVDASSSDFELWTLDDAEAWKEAELDADSEAWLEEDLVLENDLWMDADLGGTLSIRSLGQLGLRIS